MWETFGVSTVDPLLTVNTYKHIDQAVCDDGHAGIRSVDMAVKLVSTLNPPVRLSYCQQQISSDVNKDLTFKAKDQDKD